MFWRIYKYLLCLFLVLDVFIISYYLWFVFFVKTPKVIKISGTQKKIITQNINKHLQETQIIDQVSDQLASIQPENASIIARSKQYARLIDGVKIEDNAISPPLFALIIDNLVEPIGLDKASIVYEVLVEGGISRFMAVFPIDKQLLNNFTIGPIRSIRPYFIDLAQELGATLVHVGGSDEALSKLSIQNIKTLNQFYKDEYFFNNKDHKAPHHIFTSLELLTNFNKSFSVPESNISPWQFKYGANQNSLTDIESFVVKFSKNNIVKWVYNKNTGDYTRDPYNFIKAKNIIMQFTSINVIDDIGRLQIKTSGMGKAKIFLDGKQINGKWIKLKNERTRFYDQSGNEIKFNRGVTWIEIIKG